MALSVASPAFANGQRIPERCSKDVMDAAQPHVIASAETVGTFQS